VSEKGGSARKILGRDARQRSLARGSRQVQETTEPAHAPPARGRREGKKRITVDLPIPEHKFLRDYAYDNDTDGMRVVRALLMELADDPELSDRVLRRLPETNR
jgi:hypothetical protein